VAIELSRGFVGLTFQFLFALYRIVAGFGRRLLILNCVLLCRIII